MVTFRSVVQDAIRRSSTRTLHNYACRGCLLISFDSDSLHAKALSRQAQLTIAQLYNLRVLMLFLYRLKVMWPAVEISIISRRINCHDRWIVLFNDGVQLYLNLDGF